MSSPVKLYVYDLSNGLAKQMSLQLTGKQIDGIWHTSVVVFGKEVFYGQGISTCFPGRSHHGQPLHIVDMGQTALDEETFGEYLNEIREHYTADKYHLLDFNCNSFSNDCVGFLTGGSIPSWIKDLPTDFLSTPFGAALRPTIDAMYRQPTPGRPVAPAPSASDAQLTASLLEAVASRAASTIPTSPPPSAPRSQAIPASFASTGASTITAPLQLCTNPQSLQHILSSHRAVTVFFTSQTCMPCKMIEPIFERLAEEKASVGVGFAKVDLGAGMGQAVAGIFSVRATPTFIFFLDGKKTHELKGADAGELKTQVDLLIHEAFPPHPHVKLNLPVIRALSLNPILFTQVPSLDAVHSKLISFIDAAPSLSDTKKSETKDSLSRTAFPFLKTRFAAAAKSPQLQNGAGASYSQAFCTKCAVVTQTLADTLSPAELFPVVDLWRLAVLDEGVSAWCAGTFASGTAVNPILLLLVKAVTVLEKGGMASLPRNFLLTTLRMLSNCFANLTLARCLLDPKLHTIASSSISPRDHFTILLISSLLHSDAVIRTAAASLAFNIAAHCQKPLFEAQRSGRKGEEGVESVQGEGDWEVEMVSAVVEALRTEVESEDVVHRLTASLAFLTHLSPFYDTQLKPLMEVLQAKQVVLSKLKGGEEGCGEKGVTKADVRKLIEEVARGLCP